MNAKLCIGDVVKVKDGNKIGLGIVITISYRDNYYGLTTDIHTRLGNGLKIEEVTEFLIIPNYSVQYGWYKPKDLIEIVASAEKYYPDITD